MGCCGEKKTRLHAVKDLVTANVIMPLMDVAIKRPVSSRFARRIELCQQCSYRTWLCRNEWLSWLGTNTGQILVNPHTIPDATTPLPVRLEFADGLILCCTVCRCICARKARLREQECCKGLWPPLEVSPS